MTEQTTAEQAATSSTTDNGDNDKIIDYKSKTYDEMDKNEKARWYGLLMAIDNIDEHCNEKNIDFDKVFVSAVHIKHFIDSKLSYIKNEMTKEESVKQNIDVKKRRMERYFSRIKNNTKAIV